MYKPQSEEEIIQGIRDHSTAVLEYVYRIYLPQIESLVVQHNGNREQAKDVFQEGMIVAYRNIRSGRFELRSKFGTYLYGICKKIWIQERKKYISQLDKLKEQSLVVAEPEPGEEDPVLQQQLRQIFDRHFAMLSKDCQKILSMFFNMHSVEEIRKAMNYKDIHHAADRKYRCKKSLIKRMMNDPLFKQLSDETR